MAHELLDRDQEQALFTRLAAGDLTARDEIARCNQRLVVELARRQMVVCAEPVDDLIQAGNLGLLRAIEKFDHTTGHKFSTYATWWVRQAIGRHIADQSRTIRLPVWLTEARRALARAEQTLAQAGHGSRPTEAALAAEVGWSVERLREIRAALTLAATESINRPLRRRGATDDGEPRTLASVIPAEGAGEDYEAAEARVDAAAIRAALGPAMRRLTATQRKVLRLLYGLDDGEPRTQADVGRMLGVSREAVRQAERLAFEQMRRHPALRALRDDRAA